MSNQDEQKKKGAAGGPHINDMILGSLKPRTGKETSKWIAGLADESVEDAVAAAVHQPEELPAVPAPQAMARKDSKHDMMHLLDHLFDCFQQYEFEFNRTVHGTDLVVAIDRPQIATETIRQRFQPAETVQVFKGRLSTRQWTLLIRGRDQMVEGWIMPIDKLISFSGDPSSFIRFLFMESVWYNGDLQWRIDGIDVHWDNMRSLAKQLFGALVKVARGEASDQEPFSLRPKTAVDRSFDKLAAVPPQPESQPYSFNEHNPNFDSPFISNKQQQQPGPADPSKRAQIDLSGKTLQRDQTAQTQPIQVAQQQQQQAPKPEAAQRPQPNDSQLAAPAMAPSTATPMEAILDMLSQSVTTELDNLSRAGAEAFARQDLVTVERAVKRAARIKELQGEVAAQVEQWKARLRDA